MIAILCTTVLDKVIILIFMCKYLAKCLSSYKTLLIKHQQLAYPSFPPKKRYFMYIPKQKEGQHKGKGLCEHVRTFVQTSLKYPLNYLAVRPSIGSEVLLVMGRL